MMCSEVRKRKHLSNYRYTAVFRVDKVGSEVSALDAGVLTQDVSNQPVRLWQHGRKPHSIAP